MMIGTKIGTIMEPCQAGISRFISALSLPGLTGQGEALISPASPRRQRSSVVEQGNHNPLVGCSNHPAATSDPPLNFEKTSSPATRCRAAGVRCLYVRRHRDLRAPPAQGPGNSVAPKAPRGTPPEKEAARVFRRGEKTFSPICFLETGKDKA